MTKKWKCWFFHDWITFESEHNWHVIEEARRKKGLFYGTLDVFPSRVENRECARCGKEDRKLDELRKEVNERVEAELRIAKKHGTLNTRPKRPVNLPPPPPSFTLPDDFKTT